MRYLKRKQKINLSFTARNKYTKKYLTETLKQTK